MLQPTDAKVPPTGTGFLSQLSTYRSGKQTFKGLAAGSYYLSAFDNHYNGPVVNAYTMAITQAPMSCTPSNSSSIPADADEISFPFSRSVMICPSDAVEYYLLVLANPSIVNFTLSGFGAFSPGLYAYDSAAGGDHLPQNIGYSPSLSLNAGRYYIAVASSDQLHSGAVTISGKMVGSNMTRFASDALEPNDSPTSAVVASIPYFRKDLSLSPSLDVDYFTFSLSETAAIMVQVTQNVMFSGPPFIVMDAAGNFLGAPSARYSTSVSLVLKPGKYYVRVSAYGVIRPY